MSLFGKAYRWGGGLAKRNLLEIYHAYPTMMKLGNDDTLPKVIPYLTYPVGENGVITRSSNKKLKLSFRKTKL